MFSKTKISIMIIMVFTSVLAVAGFIKGFDFIAPIVNSVSSAPDQVGLIIYDQGTDSYYGKGSGAPGVWQVLTNDTSAIVPTGSILPYGGTTAPTGYVFCDGSAISRTTYADLYAEIGDAFGNGDGSTTFNVPDLRGQFLRGVDGSAGRDPDDTSRTAMNTGGNTGDAVGSVQADALQGHRHGHQIAGSGGATGGDYLRGNGAAGGENIGIGSPTTDGVNGTPRTSSETRPTNAYVHYIIKY